MSYRQSSSSGAQQVPEQPSGHVPNWDTWREAAYSNKCYERMIEHAERENERELEWEGCRAEDHGVQMPVGSDGEYSSDMEVRNEEHEQESIVNEQEANGDVDGHEQVEEDYASYEYSRRERRVFYDSQVAKAE